MCHDRKMRTMNLEYIKDKFKNRYSNFGSELPTEIFDWGEFKDEAGHDFCYSKNINENCLDICAIHRMCDDYAERFIEENEEVDLVEKLIKPNIKNVQETISSIYRMLNIQFNYKFNEIIDKQIPSTEFHFFWSNSSPFSQWHKSEFELNGITYYSAEQFMMTKKAELFNDEEIKNKILSTNNVRKQKELGRQIKNFNESIWNENKIKIVYIGNKLKFTQNQNLKSELMNTNDKLIVEASPNDKIWGIGLHEEDPNSLNQNEWKGQNLLGNILTILRKDIRIINENTTHNNM